MCLTQVSGLAATKKCASAAERPHSRGAIPAVPISFYDVFISRDVYLVCRRIGFTFDRTVFGSEILLSINLM